MNTICKFAALALFIAAFSSPAFAGPPLLCRPLSIGDAASLPSGDGPHGTNPNYIAKDLPRETIAYLAPETPVIVRMETIRRAVLYATGNIDEAYAERGKNGKYAARITSLVAAFKKRLDVKDKSSAAYAHSLFDMGYLNACLKQASIHTYNDGYADIVKAKDLLGGHAEMEFACAMICIHPKRSELKSHLERANKAASSDRLLAGNLKQQFGKE